MISIREARKSDKQEVLSFCADTFSWGDYIDQVWDLWYRESDVVNKKGDKNTATYSLLLLAELGVKNNARTTKKGTAIAVSHVALCPDRQNIWIEGLRVHPEYRRSKVATKLMQRMLNYGKIHGARNASAIVAIDNLASERMLEKIGFTVISKWAYYGTNGKISNDKKEKNEVKLKRNHDHKSVRFASKQDLENLWSYLQKSRIYRLSSESYVKAWHWYPLDRKALTALITEQRVLLVGDPIDGTAIINKKGYWDRTDVLQVVYFDSSTVRSAQSLISFIAYIYMYDKFKRLQFLFCQSDPPMSVIKENFRIKESEEFLLYSKKI